MRIGEDQYTVAAPLMPCARCDPKTEPRCNRESDAQRVRMQCVTKELPDEHAKKPRPPRLIRHGVSLVKRVHKYPCVFSAIYARISAHFAEQVRHGKSGRFGSAIREALADSPRAWSGPLNGSEESTIQAHRIRRDFVTMPPSIFAHRSWPFLSTLFHDVIFRVFSPYFVQMLRRNSKNDHTLNKWPSSGQVAKFTVALILCK
jgi:hypothetical protein